MIILKDVEISRAISDLLGWRSEIVDYAQGHYVRVINEDMDLYTEGFCPTHRWKDFAIAASAARVVEKYSFLNEESPSIQSYWSVKMGDRYGSSLASDVDELRAMNMALLNLLKARHKADGGQT